MTLILTRCQLCSALCYACKITIKKSGFSTKIWGGLHYTWSRLIYDYIQYRLNIINKTENVHDEQKLQCNFSSCPLCTQIEAAIKKLFIKLTSGVFNPLVRKSFLWRGCMCRRGCMCAGAAIKRFHFNKKSLYKTYFKDRKAEHLISFMCVFF